MDSQKHETKRGSPSRKIFLPEGYWRLLKKILTFMVKDNVIGWSFSVTKTIKRLSLST